VDTRWRGKMSKAEQAAQMLAAAKERQPRRQSKRGKVWVDSTLQVARSWLKKVVSKEHQERSKS